MEQSIKNPAERAMIKGVPVYRLSGVTADNLPVIKGTQMWVHYRHLGNAGWCLAVPDAWIDAVTQDIGQHGLELASVDKLPGRSSGIDRLFKWMLGAFGVGGALFTAAIVDGGLGGLILICVGTGLVLLMIESSNKSALCGALLASAGAGRGRVSDPISPMESNHYKGVGGAPYPGSPVGCGPWTDYSSTSMRD